MGSRKFVVCHIESRNRPRAGAKPAPQMARINISLMIQPREMLETHPIKLHDGGVSTTPEVWNMLTASYAGGVERVAELADSNPRLLTCQYDYTSPLHFAVREGHVELVRFLIERGALDPTY